MSDDGQTSAQPDQTALAVRQFQFRLEEYKSLRGEIDTRIKESFTLIIYCVTAVAAIYGTCVAAVLSDKTDLAHNAGLLDWVLFAAIIFPIFGLLKSLEAWEITLRIASHIRQFETSLELTGWERLAECHRNKPQTPLMRLSKPPYVPFWLILIAITGLVFLKVSH